MLVTLLHLTRRPYYPSSQWQARRQTVTGETRVWLYFLTIFKFKVLISKNRGSEHEQLNIQCWLIPINKRISSIWQKQYSTDILCISKWHLNITFQVFYPKNIHSWMQQLCIPLSAKPLIILFKESVMRQDEANLFSASLCIMTIQLAFPCIPDTAVACTPLCS